MLIGALRQFDGLRPAVLGALALGAFSTFGDLIWELFIPRHQMIFGLIHGGVLCMFLGLVLGLVAGSSRAVLEGVLGELGIGLLVSGGFYALYGLLGTAAMFVCWMALWLLTSLLYRRLRRSSESLGAALLRGTLAAVLSGLAFYAISGIWLAPDPEGPNYPYFLAAWTFAFLPGFLSLMIARPTLNTSSMRKETSAAAVR